MTVTGNGQIEAAVCNWLCAFQISYEHLGPENFGLYGERCVPSPRISIGASTTYFALQTFSAEEHAAARVRWARYRRDNGLLAKAGDAELLR